MIQKTPNEIELMRKAGKILKNVFAQVETKIKIGISTADLDNFIQKCIINANCKPSFLNYQGFPKNSCISVNEEVVHGIPSKDKILAEGDIVSIDIGVCYQGYHSDAARTYPVGKISEEKARLIKITEECFWEGIKNLKIGERLGKASNAIQIHAEKNGYSVVRELVGHGIGKKLHEEPQIPNYGYKTSGEIVLANTCLAIEPMINMGKKEINISENGWTIITRDHMPSSHYENTVLVTENGIEILT